MASRNAFDVAIICAGDADFFRAVEGVKEMGKEIYIASFDSSCATKLKDASLGYISLTTYLIKNLVFFWRRMSILDAKDLLVHSPRVISNIAKRMNDIKLLRYRL